MNNTELHSLTRRYAIELDTLQQAAQISAYQLFSNCLVAEHRFHRMSHDAFDVILQSTHEIKNSGRCMIINSRMPNKTIPKPFL
jgi:hypothetical protein